MQKLVRVKLSVEEYVREQYHRQMRPPSQCPNCGRFHRLWGHAYYERSTTDSCGKAIAFWVRRFRCAYCKVTVSCLPRFAPSYQSDASQLPDCFIPSTGEGQDSFLLQTVLKLSD